MKPHYLIPCLVLSVHVTGCGAKCDVPALIVNILDGTGAPAPADNLWWSQNGEEHPAEVCSDSVAATEPDTGNWCITYFVEDVRSGECTLRVEYEGMEATTVIDADLPIHSDRHCPHEPDQYTSITVPWSFE